MPTLRTFVAIEVSREVRGAVAALTPRLRSLADVRWVEPEMLHLTLNFLGDVARDAVPAICQAATAAAARHHPFEIEFRGLGAFPSPRQPRTIWLGLARGAESLRLLQADLTAELQTMGYPPEERAFTPHLTIGKVRSPAHDDDLARQLAAQRDASAGIIRVAEVVVFSSQLRGEGPKYTPLGRAALSTSQPPTSSPP